MAFNNAFAALSVKRSASSITITRYALNVGSHEARIIISRTSSIFIDKPSVRINSTSGCDPYLAVLQDEHSPQPPS